MLFSIVEVRANKARVWEKTMYDFEEEMLNNVLITLLVVLEQKKVFRWGNQNVLISPKYENNLEHCGAMQMLFNILLPAAKELGTDELENLDHSIVSRMIMLHDLAEVKVGDKKHKSPEHLENERLANDKLCNFFRKCCIPGGSVLADDLEDCLLKESLHSRFVKALDEMQAWLFLIWSSRTTECKYHGKEFEELQSARGVGEFPFLQALMKTAFAHVNDPEAANGLAQRARHAVS